MQKILLTSAAAFVFAIAASSVSVPEAEAQSGSRLCGIANGPVAMLVELKQPKSKEGRKKVNDACKKLAGEFRQGLKDGGVDECMKEKTVNKLSVSPEEQARRYKLRGGGS